MGDVLLIFILGTLWFVVAELAFQNERIGFYRGRYALGVGAMFYLLGILLAATQ